MLILRMIFFLSCVSCACSFGFVDALHSLSRSISTFSKDLFGGLGFVSVHSPFQEYLLHAPEVHNELRVVFDPFKLVMGVTEEQFGKILNKDEFVDGDTLINAENGKTFNAGKFRVVSVKELKNNFVGHEKNSPTIFNVVEGYDAPWENWFRYAVDVTALQADKKNNGALFQVASNFNALEGDGSPHAGIMSYVSPSLYVQGEAAALSAMPGLIQRMYFIKHDGVVGQFLKQINFLDDFPKKLTVDNGYLRLDMAAQLKIDNPHELDTFVDSVKVGLHENIQVSGGLGPLKSELPSYKAVPVTDPDQRISQLFTATANLAGVSNVASYETLAKVLLKAAYQGTLFAATQNKQSNKVFLTLVGGGVFKNKLDWIIDAIQEAVQKVHSAGLDVTLVIYYSGSYDKDEWAAAMQKLMGLVNATGGRWLRYKKNGIYSLKR